MQSESELKGASTMKNLVDEFKAFIMKGNVIDLAVGVLIGAAFGNVVKGFTDGIIMPLIGALGGKAEVGLKLWVFDVGVAITAIINFLIMAGILFFVFVKPMNKLKEMTMRKAETSAEPPPLPDDVKLLMEIRDLLKSQQKSTSEKIASV
jgi:large conductance mechanosensitive channel